MQAVCVYITVAGEGEAVTIARTLVAERLAAGVNVIPGARSVYRWQGAVCEAGELVVVAKTHAGLVDALTRRVRDLHAYECPCIVAMPIIGGNPAYLAWIGDQTLAAG